MAHMTPRYPRRHDLQAKRIAVGLKRSALAKLVGASYSHIYNYENGHMPLSPELESTISRELAREAKAVGVDLSEVINGEAAEGADAAPGARTPGAAAKANEAKEEVRGAA